MCIICVDLAKQKLSAHEAKRHLGEMREGLGREHAAEVDEKIREAEQAAASSTKP